MDRGINKRDLMEAGPSRESGPSKKLKTENLSSNYFRTVWTCKLCYTCILSTNHIEAHVKECEAKHNRKHPYIDEYNFLFFF